MTVPAPQHQADGSLRLTSASGRFGENGCYAVVHDGGRDYATRAPLHERFHVYVDDEGVLRIAHHPDVGPIPAVQLHYKMVRAE